MKALEILTKNNNVANWVEPNYLREAISELEESQKEDEYIYKKMKESLSMGNKAQSLVFVEVYQIINNRVSK